MQNLLDQFNHFFEYDLWANQKVLSALKSNPQISQYALEIFSHILGAQRLWYQRITGGEYNAQMVWPNLSQEECENTIQQNKKSWLDYLQDLTLDDLSKRILYTSSKGKFYEMPIYDMLMQVVMHGAYHRGQIAVLLRQANEQLAHGESPRRPPATDYIAYVREK